MKYIQVGEIGKAVLVSTKNDLPTAGIAYLNKFYVATDTNIIYTCKSEGSGYAWKIAAVLPALTNGIAAPTQLQEGVEAIDATGNKVIGTMKFVEKTANANGTYYPADDNAQGYSKFIVDVAGETAENPYIATTEAEMKAYLAEEYKDSYIRYDNSLYRPTLPFALHPKYANTTFDTNLGQNSVNALIDKWLGTDSQKKILGYENQGYYFLTEGGVNVYVYEHYVVEIYVYKLLKSDGTYARAIAGIDAFGKNIQSSAAGYDASAAIFDKDGIILYIDNCTIPEFNTLLGSVSYELTVDGHTETITNLTADSDYQLPTGWIYNYISATDINEGAAYFSNNIYRYKSDFCNLTFAYNNAAVLIGQALYPENSHVYKQESAQFYRDGYTYKVNRKDKKSISHQAESPLAVGDQVSGATWHLNPNFTIENLKDVIKEIPYTEYGTSSVGFLFLDVDNPFTLEESAAAYTNLWGFAIIGGNGSLTANMLMYALVGDSSEITSAVLLGDMFGSPINSFAQTSITIPATWGANLLGTACTTPATITKINHSEILNQFVGKTANFIAQDVIVTSYEFTVADALGGMTEIGDSDAMTAITTNNIAPWIVANTVVRYTGKDASGYKQGALYIITEGN
nr:MAG TPA: hypothetical protein [Caudoviricetes sp.]